MIELELAALRKLRCWLGELPGDARIPGGANSVVRGKRVAAEARGESASRSAAVELYIPSTPRRYYGLLGGTLIPHQHEGLFIEAAWTDEPGDAPGWVLDSQRPRRGLTRAECEQVVAAGQVPEPVAGIVKITHAVTSEIDTAPVVLATVMRILLEILWRPSVAESDDSLRELATGAIQDGILAHVRRP